MENLLKNYRMVDLSQEVYPGSLNIKNEYAWGNTLRRFEIRQFIATIDNLHMHFVDAETHVGTHVEAPAHLKPGLKSPAELPLSTFIGEAIVLKFTDEAVGPKELADVKEGDIVLLYSPGEKAYVTPEGGKYLLEKKIKLLGVQGVWPDDPRAYEPGSGVVPETHYALLGNDIPMIENIVNLESISAPRVQFIAFPLRIHRIDSVWIRAVAFEPVTEA